MSASISESNYNLPKWKHLTVESYCSTTFFNLNIMNVCFESKQPCLLLFSEMLFYYSITNYKHRHCCLRSLEFQIFSE